MPVQASAGDLFPRLKDHFGHYALDLGVSLRNQFLELAKTENGQSAAETLISNGGVGMAYPVLNLVSPDVLGGSWWGFYVESGAFWYHLDQQRDKGTVVVQGQNLGTVMRGWGAYIDPTIYLTLGRHNAFERKGLALRAGLGYGLGVLHVDGNVRWRQLPGQPTESYLLTKLDQSANVFLELRFMALRARLATAAPRATAGNATVLSFSDASFDLAWTFSLAGWRKPALLTGGPTAP